MIDTALVGNWNNGGAGTWQFLRSGEFFVTGASIPYVLQNGGDILVTSPPSGAESFTRTGGGSGGIVGVWSQTHAETDGSWVEEWTLREDGSFTIHWTHDGAFDTEYFGWYTDSGTDITLDERRGQLLTGPGMSIVQSFFWGPILTGTYSVATDGNSWTFQEATGDIVYVRV
jgi:hypothetical protein